MLRVMALAIFLTVGGVGRVRADSDLGGGPDAGQPAPGEHRKEPDEPPIVTINRPADEVQPTGGCELAGRVDATPAACMVFAGFVLLLSVRLVSRSRPSRRTRHPVEVALYS